MNIGLLVNFDCSQNNGKNFFIMMYCLSMLNPTIYHQTTDSTPLVNEAHGIWTYVTVMLEWKLLLWKCVKPENCLWHCDFHMSTCKFHIWHLHQASLSSTVLQFAIALLNIYLLTTVTSCLFSSQAIKIFIVLKSKSQINIKGLYNMHSIWLPPSLEPLLEWGKSAPNTL